MPRIRNLVDYSTEESEQGRSRPHETIVDVAQNDSVQRITVYIEPRMFVQLSRVPTSEKGSQGWQIVTNVDAVKTRDTAILTQTR